MTAFTVRHFRSEDYVIASIFARCPDGTQALLGTLRMDRPTWDDFQECLVDGSGTKHCKFEEK